MTDDQKRALAIGGTGLGALLLWRRLQRGNTTTATPVSTQGQIAPYTPQSPVTLDAGQSVYDPNSEGLLNTPGALPPQAATPSGPGYRVNVYYPKTIARVKHARKPVKRKVKVKR